MSTTPAPDLARPVPPAPPRRGLEWVFVGEKGLRAGWSVLLAYWLFSFFRLVIGSLFVSANLIDRQSRFSAASALTLELIPFLAMLVAGGLMAVIEHRRLAEYNLTGPRRGVRFASGLGAGFLALSALVGTLAWGGWLHFGEPALGGLEILRFAAVWGGAFLLVGCVEEGLFRCYLLFTLTRGLNFWWALVAEAGLCGYLALQSEHHGASGVFALALLGLVPCFFLDRRKAEYRGFWQAAWVTSTFFALIHSFNQGESWLGIFAAGSMGLVLCVSVRLTGSAWWAIGCHAAWDWAQTFFYGTPDSGLSAQGHFLTTNPAGDALLSGGAAGPEGSVLVLAAILLLLAALLLVYARRKPSAEARYSGPYR